MNVLGDLLARDRRSDASALLASATGHEYDYRRFCTTAWKVGNFLRHFGVRDGSTVALAEDPQPQPILVFLGTALLGGITQIDPPRKTDARVLITPAQAITETNADKCESERVSESEDEDEDENDDDDEYEYDLPMGGQRIVYGGPSNDPSVEYFEQGVWSENPTKPPGSTGPDQAVLRSTKSKRTYTHAEILNAARSIVGAWGLTEDDVVAIRTPLREPETIAAGVVAPLLVGGTILLPDEESVGDYAIANAAPEPRVIPPDTIKL
ncbi:long-chain fatty acid--CoA ligase [Halocatena marina]|uniref:long-chain fatty acid--CoA ligase n=1 Tax=Halocatena marina TaxID=2934937 RepID=UPI002224C3D1|nr:long-chain fatty acid--CoA ligase [Halocatena marina]